MVGFRVFDVGLLIVWLIWFFRLRDDDDDSRGDDGGGGEGPDRIPSTTVPAAACASRSAAGATAAACATTSRRRGASAGEGRHRRCRSRSPPGNPPSTLAPAGAPPRLMRDRSASASVPRPSTRPRTSSRPRGEVDAVTAPHLGRHLLCPNGTVLRPFQITGLVDRMPIFPSREAAIRRGLAAA